MELLDEAKDIIMMGRARKSMVITPEVKAITAHHEAGHALVSLLTEGGNPIYKATLIPRGNALGMVTNLPKEDQLMTKESMLHRLDVCMGGRAAEELIFGKDKITGGAANDFAQATWLARHMICQLGMSVRLGPVHYSSQDLAHLSPAMKDIIDEEVRLLLDNSYHRVFELLKKKKNQLCVLAKALLEKETLSSDEIKRVIKWHPLDVEPAANTSKSTFQVVDKLTNLIPSPPSTQPLPQ